MSLESDIDYFDIQTGIAFLKDTSLISVCLPLTKRDNSCITFNLFNGFT